MLQIPRRIYGLSVQEAYFAPEDYRPEPKVDVVFFVQSSLAGRQGAVAFHTLLVDLGQTEESLLSQLSKNCRYEVRRARDKDGLVFRVNSTPSIPDIMAFCDFYAPFAATTGIAAANAIKLTALIASQALTLTSIEKEPGCPLAQHAYLHDTQRARLLYSASRFRDCADSATRSLIGRANRLLHWLDMLSFKERAFSVYDLGGLALSENLSGVDSFKKEFGGRQVTEYNLLLGFSLLGRLAKNLLRLKQRMANRAIRPVSTAARIG